MFKNKKFLSIFVAETVLPWIIAVLGIIDVFIFDDMGNYYREKLMDKYDAAQRTFNILYRITTVYAIILLIAFLVISIIAFIVMIVKLCAKEKVKYQVARPLVICIYSGACFVGSLILLLLTIAFTIGMSV